MSTHTGHRLTKAHTQTTDMHRVRPHTHRQTTPICIVRPQTYKLDVGTDMCTQSGNWDRLDRGHRDAHGQATSRHTDA